MSSDSQQETQIQLDNKRRETKLFVVIKKSEVSALKISPTLTLKLQKKQTTKFSSANVSKL